jgi:hypothetical protein
MKRTRMTLAIIASVLATIFGASFASPANAAPHVTYSDTSLQASTPFSEGNIILGAPTETGSPGSGFTIPVTCSGIDYSTLAVVDGNSGTTAGFTSTPTGCGSGDTTLTVGFSPSTPIGTYAFEVTGSPNPSHGAVDIAAVIVTIVSTTNPSDSGNTVCTQNVVMSVPPNTVYPNIQFGATETTMCYGSGGEATTTSHGFSLQAVNPSAGLAAASGELTASGSTLESGTYDWATVIATAGSFSVASETFTLGVTADKVYSGKTYTGTVVNNNGKCLDIDNAFGTASAGLLTQLWKCGAAGGEDQEFSYNTVTHELVYDAKNNGDGYCVAEVGYNSQGELEPCGSTGTSVTWSDKHYEFADGTVLDDAGFHTNNGNRVETYAANGGTNQDWTLPQ